ncbi:MAG: hypothetical protein U1E86_00715 [Burkholderiaceae bacterium]
MNQNVLPPAPGASDAGVAAHQLREPPRDRKAQPGAAVASRRRIVGLLERGEEPAQFLGCDPHAGVVDLEPDHDVLGRLLLAGGANRTVPASVKRIAFDT